MTAEYHNIEEKWLESFPTHWKMCRLKDYTSTNTGITFTKADLVESGNAVLSYGQIHAKNNPTTKINHELIRFIPDSFVTDKQSSKVKEGDFIFADTSEDLNGCGNCIYINEPMDLYAGYHTIILRNKGLSCGKYFAYLFMTDQWRSQIRKRVKSVKLYSVTQGILNQTFIIVPPIEEQELIVSYLDKECDKITREIALLERKIKCYHSLQNSLINKVVRRGLNPNVSMKQSEVPFLNEIPEHWHIFNDIISNIMLAWKGSLGRTKYNGIVSPAYGVYKPIDELNSSFYHYLFRTKLYKSIFRINSRGIIESRLRLYTPNFLGLSTVYPPIEEQHEIVNYLDEKYSKIDSIIEKIKLKIGRLKELKRSLINEVVTGQRTIKTSDL